MADVLMEYKGKQKRIPADKVDVVIRAGGRVISEPTAPAATSPAPAKQEGPGLLDRAGAAVRRVSQAQQDAGAAALRGLSFGLDDVVAGGAARLGDFVQRQMDSDDGALSGGGESVAESWRKSAPAYDEGVKGRRAEVEAARTRSPTAATVGEAGGFLATLPMGGATTLPGRVAQAGAMGALGGAGFGDADDAEEMAADAAKGAALAGGATALLGGAALAAPVVARRAGAAVEGMKRAAPAVAGRAAGVLERGTAAAETANPLLRGALALATGGGSEVGLAGAKTLARGLRQAATPAPVPVPARPAWLAGLVDDIGAVADDAPSGLELAARAPKAAPPAVAPQRAALRILAPIDDVADDVVKPAAAPTPMPAAAVDDAVARAKPVPVPAPPAPASGPAGEVLTDLRRSTLGRLPTQEEIRRAIEAVAIREGTTDIATLSNKIGVPTTKLRDVLVPMLRDFQFRQAVASGRGTVPGASSALDEAMDAGRTVRVAKETARSPIDNVSGRQAGQVAAVRQQEQWRAAFDRLPPEQRAGFIDQLRRTSGLPDDVIRQRLKMTKAEWRRTSFTRSEARTPEMNRLEALDSLSP